MLSEMIIRDQSSSLEVIWPYRKRQVLTAKSYSASKYPAPLSRPGPILLSDSAISAAYGTDKPVFPPGEIGCPQLK